MRLIDADEIRIKPEYMHDICGVAMIRVEDMARILNDMPTIQPEPHWIPTSKERPPKRKHIWITDVYGGVEVVYRGDGRLWLNNDDNGYVEDEIVAWMYADIPSPYQPEEESE